MTHYEWKRNVVTAMNLIILLSLVQLVIRKKWLNLILVVIGAVWAIIRNEMHDTSESTPIVLLHTAVVGTIANTLFAFWEH